MSHNQPHNNNTGQPYYETSSGAQGYQGQPEHQYAAGQYASGQYHRDPNHDPGQNLQTPEPDQRIGLGVTAMVIGIVAILVMIVPFLAIPFGLAAAIMGGIAVSNRKGKGFGIAGIITGVIGLIVSLGIGLFTVWFVGELNESADNWQQEAEENMQGSVDQRLEEYKADIEKRTDETMAEYEDRVRESMNENMENTQEDFNEQVEQDRQDVNEQVEEQIEESTGGNNEKSNDAVEEQLDDFNSEVDQQKEDINNQLDELLNSN